MTTPASQGRAALTGLLRTRLDGTEPWSWLSRLLDAKADAIRQALPQLGRVLGHRALVGAFAERDHTQIPSAYGPLKVGHWRVDEAARILLLAQLTDSERSPHAALFALYDQGDTDTRAAAVRALNFVEDPDVATGLKLIRDAGRTYLDALLRAAWVENPFASKHLSDHDFRKAVLKALFVDVPVEGFIGLAERADPELALSLCEFADEREAAGRPVPPAVWTVAALHPRPGLVARLVGRMEHPLPGDRLVAAQALANARDPRALPFILDRISREPDDQVRAALERARDRT